ncbi:IS3 family transposase, partial [Virgibacillus xinjiangensis]
FKYMVARRYLDERISYRDLSDEVGVDHSTLRHWVKMVEYHGANAFTDTYTNYTPAFKMIVVERIEKEGASIRDAAAFYKIPDISMVRRWKKKWDLGGEDAFTSCRRKERYPVKKKQPSSSHSNDSMDDLKAELEYLRMENEYFKKVECLSSRKGKITQRDKAQVIYELRHKYPVRTLLLLAGIPKSTYYYWVDQMGQPDPDAELKTAIANIYHKHKGRYGYRRICLELRSCGYLVNHKKVQRIMNTLGLKSVVRVKKYRSYKGKIGKTAPNLLSRDFSADRPNQKWVTDITEFKLCGEKLYLSAVLDLFNSELIAYTLDSRPTYSLVSAMLDKALPRLNENDQLVMHSDQGWHYQMKQFRKTLEEHGITQSMSRRGNCFDNAVIENFFGIMKSEFLYLNDFTSVEQFKKELSDYMSYYNEKRIKNKLDGMSPT